MAGTARPDNLKIKLEMTKYELGEWRNNNSGTYPNVKPSNLFNQKVNESWEHAFDWNSTIDYMTITIHEKCNVWRYGHASYTDQNSALNIIPNTYTKQRTLERKAGWQLWIEGLEPGTYTFKATGGLRLDMEWYFECVQTPSALVQSKVLDTINNNKLFQKCAKYQVEED
jgi:hypothetical protein